MIITHYVNNVKYDKNVIKKNLKSNKNKNKIIKKEEKMETKLILREFNIMEIQEKMKDLQNKLNELNREGWTTKASNITTINKIGYTIYVLMERDVNNEQ